jgi:Flp pilus assembly pilin Flp
MNRFSDDRGAATVEFALVAPILLIIMLGVIEFGRAFERVHAIVGISRESANLAARGTSLQQSAQVAMNSGSDIELSKYGGVIASEVVGQGKVAVVKAQYATAGYAGKSRIGNVGSPAAQLASRNLQAGQSAFVVEVFYKYKAVTPLSRLSDVVFPSTLYERSVF